VGLMALQLAAGRWATPVVTASPSKHGFLRDLGALPRPTVPS
jgi:NADPH:quinone reductase-like Zn-dependent oxidoreductase